MKFAADVFKFEQENKKIFLNKIKQNLLVPKNAISLKAKLCEIQKSLKGVKTTKGGIEKKDKGSQKENEYE